MEKSKILIVEDEKIIAFHIEKLLTGFGYEITDKVISAEDAIQSVQVNSPDLVLMDISLSGEKDGIYAADEIRKKKNIPIIFLTANTDEKTFQRAKITEPFGYINKPFQGRELKSNIEIALYTNKMRKKVYESEQWLYTTLNSIGDSVIATDTEERIKFINKKAEQLLGIEKENVLSKKIDEVVKIEEDTSDESLILNFASFLNNPDLLSYLKNKFLINSKNEKIPVEETVSKINDSDGNVIGSAYVYSDVSEKRKARIELIKNRNFYLTLFEKLPVMIWQTNTQGEFKYFNQSWLDFRGEEIEDEISDKWLKDIHYEDRDRFLKLYKNNFDKKFDIEIEFRLRNKNGDYCWILCYAKPFEDNNNDFIGYIGACYDITNRKQMEEALINAKTESDNANKAKSNFIAMMSHELRTPMNGIIGIADIINDLSSSTEQKTYTGILMDSAKSLLDVLNSILELTRIESGHIFKNESEFNLQDLIEETTEAYRLACKKKGLDFIINIDEDIEVDLKSDYLKIKQMLTNLLSNAVKFTQSGFIKLTVQSGKNQNETKYQKNIQECIFIVEDTGIGIEKDKQEIIFDSFRQADESHTRKFEGIGLGLSITKQLAKILDGNIWVESKKDVGSKFYLHLVCKLNRKNELSENTNQRR